MNMSSFRYSSLLTVSALVFALGSTFAGAQNGKLNLRVRPKQAYVFVDDRAISEASKHPSLSLSVGEHKIEIVNYGYTPVTRTVNIEAGKTADLEVSLHALGERVSGQFGAISIKGADLDAVLLNGNNSRFLLKKLGNMVLAYNRRVDLTLNATGQESALTYPFNADDFASLVDRNGLKKANGVELAAEKERIGNKRLDPLEQNK